MCLTAETVYKGSKVIGTIVGTWASGGFSSGAGAGLKKVGTKLASSVLPSDAKDAIELISKTTVIGTLEYYIWSYNNYADYLKKGKFTDYKYLEDIYIYNCILSSLLESTIEFLVDLYEIPDNKFKAFYKAEAAYIKGLGSFVSDGVKFVWSFVSPNKADKTDSKAKEMLNNLNSKINSVAGKLGTNAEELTGLFKNVSTTLGKALKELNNLRNGLLTINKLYAWTSNYFEAVDSAEKKPVNSAYGNLYEFYGDIYNACVAG